MNATVDIRFPVQDAEAQRLWRQFEHELDAHLRDLSQSEAAEIKLELLSHVYESAKSKDGSINSETLENAIHRLGKLNTYLEPWIEATRIEYGTRRGDPRAAMKLMLVGAQQGVLLPIVVIVIGLLYLFFILLFILGGYAVFNDHAGLWIGDNGGWSLSFEAQPNQSQWLPAYFPWLAMFLSVFGYFTLNQLIAVMFRRKASKQTPPD